LEGVGICIDQKLERESLIWRFMGIFSENRPEWFLTELACIGDSISIVPVPVRAADHTSVS